MKENGDKNSAGVEVEGVITRINSSSSSNSKSSSSSSKQSSSGPSQEYITASVNVPRYGIEGNIKIEKTIGETLKVFDRIKLRIEASDRDFRNRTSLIFMEKI